MSIRYFLILLFCLGLIGITTAQSSSSAPEIPLIHPQDNIVHHLGYTLCYNETHEQASWVAYELTAAETEKIASRTNKFLADPFVSTGSATDEDYKGSGYDRGHLAPAADMGWSFQTMSESFYYSNMSPQVPSFNRGIWKKLEELVREWAITYQKIEITTGPVLSDHLDKIGIHGISVPHYYYKVILDLESPQHKCIGFVLPNEASAEPLENFAVSVDSVERLTGIDFFTSLPDKEENELEQHVCLPCWNWVVSTFTATTHHFVSTDVTSENNTHHSPSATNSAVQCSAITQKGTRCKRMTKNKSGKCWQHE